MKTLLRDERGTSVVELALMAPIMAGMLIGAVDLAFGYSAKLELEQAAQRGVERVMQQRSVETDYSDLKPEVATAAGVDQANVTIDQWLECNDVRQDAGTVACAAATDVYARYVEVSVQDTYTPYIGGLKFLGANDNGSFTITGTAGLRIQ